MMSCRLTKTLTSSDHSEEPGLLLLHIYLLHQNVESEKYRKLSADIAPLFSIDVTYQTSLRKPLWQKRLDIVSN